MPMLHVNVFQYLHIITAVYKYVLFPAVSMKVTVHDYLSLFR